jgi:uncharacterized protein
MGASMVERKTPAVFIQEIPGFSGSVVEVATAVPAFIGYTEFAAQGAKTLLNIPFRISSIADYASCFGGPPATQFDIVETSPPGGAPILVEPDTTPADVDKDSYIAHRRYYLYYAMRLFFDNGGADCYIVSVGKYGDPFTKADLIGALDLLKAEPEPAMIVIPDAMSLSRQEAEDLQQQILLQCSTLQNRVAILDVFAGDTAIDVNDPIGKFRDGVGIAGLSFGAAYYPWIETSIAAAGDINTGYLTPKAFGIAIVHVKAYIGGLPSQKEKDALAKCVSGLLVPSVAVSAAKGLTPAQQQAHNALLNAVPYYKQLMDVLLGKVNLLPPSGAVAGVYARTDFTQGVFKAPAGTSLASVLKPVVTVSNQDQQDLSVPLDGKAVNAIRTIPGSGVALWGARTLDGNSRDTRYINVRRTLIMLEQSIKNGLQIFVFQSNTASTWTAVESMINGFLLNQWKDGALLGATPTDAYYVKVGLGVTMTGEDIQNGLMNVEVLVALMRPAEFIVLTFRQTMSTA